MRGEMDTEKITEELLDFIAHSPTAFHAVENVRRRLEEAGFERAGERAVDTKQTGGKYYMTRNDSSLIAFYLPECGKEGLSGLRIVASHSDSPCFKIKENPEMDVEGRAVKLNTEAYGGTILSSWLDRPLSIAGRLIVEEESGMAARLIDFDRDLCVIPNVAIHFNREINKGYAYNPQVDMLPLFSTKEEGTDAFRLKSLCAKEAGVEEERILASDLYLYSREKGRRMGAAGEFIGSPRLDDLQCAFGSLKGFLASQESGEESNYGAVYALFDNEEIGSGTKQGADSTFLSDAVDWICDFLGLFGGEKRALLAGSFLISADNAHAVHPNHPEKSDPTNRPFMNGGIVLKFQGSQKYTTDAWSAAVVRGLCRKEGIPCQNFANRADVPGGSTLGNLSARHVAVPAADIGLAQLAMHSAFETAGEKDTAYLVSFCRAFFAGR